MNVSYVGISLRSFFLKYPFLSSTRLYHSSRRSGLYHGWVRYFVASGLIGQHLVVHSNRSLSSPASTLVSISSTTGIIPFHHDCAPHCPHSHPFQLLFAFTRSTEQSPSPLFSISRTISLASSRASGSPSSIHNCSCLAAHLTFHVPFPNSHASPPAPLLLPLSTAAISLSPSP